MVGCSRTYILTGVDPARERLVRKGHYRKPDLTSKNKCVASKWAPAQMTQFVRVWPTLPREPRMRHRPTLDADIPSLADIFSSRRAPSQRQSGLHKPVQPSINSKKKTAAYVGERDTQPSPLAPGKLTNAVSSQCINQNAAQSARTRQAPTEAAHRRHTARAVRGHLQASPGARPLGSAADARATSIGRRTAVQRSATPNAQRQFG